METTSDLTALEDSAYSGSYADGIVDLFVGLSLVWVGIAWVWLPDLAGLAGVFPAIFIAPMIQYRKRLLEPRIGHVKWSKSRRRWEARNLLALIGLGVLTFGLGVGVFIAQSGGTTDVLGTIAPALPSWLLALGGLTLGLMFRIPRAFGYAALLVVAGAGTIWLDSNPGWGLLTAGVGITVAAVFLMVRFFGTHPVVEAS